MKNRNAKCKLDIIKCFTILPILLIRRAGLLAIGRKMEMPIAELFLQEIFSGNPSRMHTNIVMMLFGMFEIVVFNLLFGNYLYRDLHENADYIFVRYPNRIKWFCLRAKRLVLYTTLYVFLFLGITFVLCVNFSSGAIDETAIWVLFITYIMLCLFTYWTTLIINLLSMYLGSTMAFISLYVVMVVLAALAIGHEKIPVINQCPLLLKMNPIANVVIQWESGSKESLFHAVYFICWIIITLCVGSIFVKQIDIGLNNKEKAN